MDGIRVKSIKSNQIRFDYESKIIIYAFSARKYS
jgi:hypothetical protein